eukprot:6308780-Ditylum_brightwellii.AAC.1
MTTVLDMDKEQKNALHQMIRDGSIVPGKTSLDISQATRTKNKISLPPGKINIKAKNRAPPGRNLATITGTKRFLAIKVEDTNGLQLPDSTAAISDNIFGTGHHNDAVNLKSQLYDCSFGEVNVSIDYSDYPAIQTATSSIGVLEVVISVDLTTSSRASIRNAVTAAVEEKLGIALPGPFDYVMYLLEGCYVECGWAAYAYVNSWNSVYQGSSYAAVGVQVHEL